MTTPILTTVHGDICDTDLELDVDVDEDDGEIDPETARIIDQIMAQRDATTNPQQRADLVLAALGYRLADAAFIALTTDDEEDCFVVAATLDADRTVTEIYPEDDCLASNLEITETDGAEPVWALPDTFRPHWIPRADLNAAGIRDTNVMTFEAATSDLRALWSVDR